MSMSQFASVADYKAALDADKSAAAGHYATEVTKAEAEAQRDEEAAMWRKVASMSMFDLSDLVYECDTMADFIKRITEQ